MTMKIKTNELKINDQIWLANSNYIITSINDNIIAYNSISNLSIILPKDYIVELIHPKLFRCILCNKLINSNSCCSLDNGVLFTGQAGFGSEFDGDQFEIILCDGCIKNAKYIRNI